MRATASVTSANLARFAVPPLALNQCIYVCDTCTMLASDVACAHPPAPAPAMSPRMTVVAMLVLGLVALFRLPLAFMPDVEQPMLGEQLHDVLGLRETGEDDTTRPAQVGERHGDDSGGG